MSNLGGYQMLTTAAKTLKGPRNLVLAIFGSGLLGGVGICKLSDTVNRRKKKAKTPAKEKEFIVKKEGISNEGLAFKINDKFRVLENDGDAVLIEKIGDNNNPYFVSANLLMEISDYK